MEKPDPAPAHHPGEPVMIDGATTAPIIYFDYVPTLGSNGGIVNLMLVAGLFHPAKEGAGTVAKAVVVAHLRCTTAVAAHLRDSINKALFLGEPAEGGKN